MKWKNEVTVFGVDDSDFSVPEPNSNWNKILIFSDKRSKAHLIVTLFRTFFSIQYSYWLTVHRPAKCTFRGIWSCFNENLVTLCFHIQTDQLRIPSLFFSKFLTYQNLYLLFSHKVGGRLCLFYFLKIYTITCIIFL